MKAKLLTRRRAGLGSWELDVLVWLGGVGDLWDMQVKVTFRRRLGLGESHDCEGYMDTLTQVGGGLLQEHSCHPFTTYQSAKLSSRGSVFS